jgi:hypothetical protein
MGARDGAYEPGYAVVDGHTAAGDHHVYELSSRHGNTWWEDELGNVQAVQYHDSESRNVRDISGNYIEHQERQLLNQMERDGQRMRVADGDWRTTSREYDPDHKKPPFNLLGWL